MMHSKVILSDSRCIYRNLAFEEALMDGLEAEEVILYLWINEKAVVLGNNQCAYLECDMNFCRDHQIAVARRRSGGGCVYHDPGNLNFSFLYHPGTVSKEALQELVRHALEAAAKVSVMLSGNDFLADGRKVSGMAFYEEDDRALLHGCILVDSDREVMAGALKVHVKKLRSHGVDSVAKRVINLKEINPDLQISAVSAAIQAEFDCSFQGGAESEKKIKLVKESDLKGDWQPYCAEEWVLLESPACELLLETEAPDGLYQLAFGVADGRIREPRLYTDAEQVSTEACEGFAKALEGMTYEEERLRDKLDRFLSESNSLICSGNSSITGGSGLGSGHWTGGSVACSLISDQRESVDC